MPLDEIDLSESALLGIARKETGLEDFGDESFLPGMRIYLADLERSARLHPLGRQLMQRTIVRLLSNRLLLQRDLKDFPELQRTVIPRPLYVLGFPRTGTTLLHNLLARDPNAQYIRLYEGFYPVPPRERDSRGRDPRIPLMERTVATFHRLAPKLVAAHPLVAEGPEECLWLMEHGFRDLILELRVRVPEYSAWLERHEGELEVYEDYQRFLQRVAWGKPARHWVFKTPRHLFGLDGLFGVFPEARVIWTHRDPAEVAPSLCSLSEIDRAIFSDFVDRQELGAFWTARLEAGLAKALAFRDADPRKERYLDVAYASLVRDPVGTVRRIYRAHDYEFTPEFEESMRQWLADNRQHKHGKHEYSAEDYGLSAEGLRERFAGYRERFGV